MMKVRERVLVLSLCLIVVVAVPGFLYRLAMDQDSWRPNDIYNSVGGSYYSSASVGSGSSDGVAVSVRGGVRSSRRVAAPVFSYARSAEGLSAIAVANSQSPIANSQGLYTTSSHMAKSFGSGFATGAASSSQLVSNSNQPATSTLSVLSIDPSQFTNANAIYAQYYTPVSSVVSAVGADAAPSVKSAPARSGMMSGPRRLPGISDTWDTWLKGLGAGDGFLYVDDEGNRYYDMALLYDAFIDAQKNGDFPGWTWEDFLDQYFTPSSKHNVPLGEPWVLLILALAYVGYVFIRRSRAREV
jgi:hypothetical protein